MRFKDVHYLPNFIMNFPSELKYTEDHEWIRIEGDTAVIGITDYAQNELGDIVYVDINTVGDTLEKETFSDLLKQ